MSRALLWATATVEAHRSVKVIACCSSMALACARTPVPTLVCLRGERHGACMRCTCRTHHCIAAHAWLMPLDAVQHLSTGLGLLCTPCALQGGGGGGVPGQGR